MHNDIDVVYVSARFSSNGGAARMRERSSLLACMRSGKQAHSDGSMRDSVCTYLIAMRRRFALCLLC